MAKPIEIRFWKNVKIGAPDECWEWQGGKSGGYGNIRFRGKAAIASRVSYILHNGIIPDNLWVLHKCDNPPCVNPSHLFLGTKSDNAHDRDKKGRTATGKRNGRHTRPESTVRGEDSGRAKLTEKQVKEIRQRYAEGSISMRKLGNEYNISHTQVRYLVDGASWKHLK